ncbi:hypothetical protein Hdeb2414_s0009g00323871 [Helianthus debilis subsp. tardiflorus]
MVVQCSLSVVILVGLSLCTNVELLTYCDTDMVRFGFFGFGFCFVLIVFSVSFLSDSNFSVVCFVFFLFGFGFLVSIWLLFSVRFRFFQVFCFVLFWLFRFCFSFFLFLFGRF